MMRGAALLRLLGLFVLVLWCVAGCTGSQETSPPTTGSFVGEVPDADAFVAVVANPAENGAQEVRAYLCTGKGGQINEWFVGSADGNDLALASEGGAQLEGNLTSEGVTGTITLPESEEPISFNAAPATGISGLYDVIYSPDGTFNGTSEEGAGLEAHLGEEVRPEIFRISGTGTPADKGEPVEIEAFAGRSAEPVNFRFIVLPDGKVKGGKKGVRTTNWIDSTTDP